MKRADLARAYRERLARFPNLSLVAPDVEICERAAELRARITRLRLPDALHLATAIASGASAFVTNDRDLAGITELVVIGLADLA